MTQAPLITSGKPLAGVLASELTAQRGALRQAFELGAGELRRGAVHDLRVAVRRLESIILLAKAVGSQPRKRLERQLARLLQSLSPLRDAHVAQRAARALPPEPKGQKRLARYLSKQKRRLEPEVKTRLAAFDLDGVERDIQELSQSLSALPNIEGSEPDAALGEKLDRLRAAIVGRRSIASAERPKSLHRLRIALKRYRYALEALGDRVPPEVARDLRTAEELQKQLGQAHDAHQLAKLARSYAKKHRKLRPFAKVLAQASDLAQRDGADASAKAPLSA